MEGYFCDRWRIGLEDAIFLPLLLVFLLDRYKAVSFFGLSSRFIRDMSKMRSWRVLTPFNSFVFETVTVSNAFTAESTLAMILEFD